MGSQIDGQKGSGMQGRRLTAGGNGKVLHRNSNKESLSYEDSLRCSPNHSSISTLPHNTMSEAQRFLPQSDTPVVGSGATHLYISPTAPHVSANTSNPKISLETATGHVVRLSATASLPIPQLAAYFPNTGYIMTYVTKILVGV